MAGFDLGSIISEAAKLSGTQTQQSQQIADLNNASAQLSQGAADNISQAGSLQAQAQTVQLQGQLATQKARVTAANALGTNVNDVSDIITQIGTGMRTTAIELDHAQAEVSEIEANSDILTNPAGWFKDLVQGDAARAKRDSLAARFDTLQKTGMALNQQTQSTVATQNAITETLTQASISQAADATKLLADAEASKQRIAGMQYGSNAVEALRQNGAQQFNRDMQVYNLLTEDARYKEGFALRQLQFQSLQEQRAKGKMEDKEYIDATGRINSYRTAAGLAPVNESFVRRTLTQGGELGDDIRRQELSGMKLMNGSAKVFGETPSDTIQTLLKDQPNLPESFKSATNVLQQASQAAQAEIAAKSLTPEGADLKKDPAAKAQILNQAVTATALSLQSNVQTGKQNPYEAPAVSVVLAEPNGLADTAFGKVVLSTLSSTGQDNPSPDMLMATGLAAVQRGELTLNDVRDGITGFYQNSVALNNATKGFLQLGVPVQQGYRTKVEGFQRSVWDSAFSGLALTEPGIGSGVMQQRNANEKAAAKPLDLTKSTDVTLALTVMQSKKLAEDILKRAPQ